MADGTSKSAFQLLVTAFLPSSRLEDDDGTTHSKCGRVLANTLALTSFLLWIGSNCGVDCLFQRKEIKSVGLLTAASSLLRGCSGLSLLVYTQSIFHLAS